MKKVFSFILVCCGLWGNMDKGAAQNVELYRDYQELTDGRKAEEGDWILCKKPVNAVWGSTDIRYDLLRLPGPDAESRVWRGNAWKGERVNLQALLWTQEDLGEVGFSVTDLVATHGQCIPSSAVKAGFVRYVMTDELNKDKKGTCGYRPDKTVYDSSLVADVIDIQAVQKIQARQTRPLWLTIQLPRQISAGVYRGKLRFSCEKAEIPPLQIELKVLNRELPSPEAWSYRLDLWQNPFAVARYYKVPLWSEAHFEAMRPVMKLLAEAGQKTITASIMHKPWGGQTEDYFESMILRIKKLNGDWQYDYAVFDKWVEFMMSLGIDRQINCYTMIPWSLSFQYFDQASNSLKAVQAEVGSPEYTAYWQPFLEDFARHLKEKGWFGITAIAMDERPLQSMQIAIRLIREADPAYKIALAGNYHDELEGDIFDYSIASGQFFPENVGKERKAEGKVSTYYTCCTESYPNTYTFSSPAEAAWLGWYAAAKHFDGYLRWAYNSWTKDPLTDSRFRAFGGGDCYLVYPGGRSSIRMERLIEGIQDYEKVRLLKEKFQQEKNTYRLKLLEDILKDFEIEKLSTIPAADMVNRAREALNKL